MRLRKIKSLKDGITIEYQEPAPENKWANYTIQSPEPARPQFEKALGKLTPYLIDVCEIGALGDEDTMATGVTLSYKGEHEIMNAVITGQHTRKNSGGCNNFNTPIKAAEAIEGEAEAEKNILPENCVKAIMKVIEEAKLFIKGDRGQVKMELEDNEDSAS